MLLTITTTHQPATDLGYLLHKNPARLQTVEVSGGQAHVFYPEATAERCTAALLLDLDPIGLVRGRGGAPGEGFSLEQYVNDRPYVASSFLSVALSKAFSTAMNGTCKDRPTLPEQPLPLAVTVAVVSAPGPDWPRRLFEPLCYEVETEAYTLDPTVPDWGDSQYYTLHLRHDGLRLQDVLTHLYVLLPVLDNNKHYYIDQNEADKLLHRGGDWLPRHPERGFITRRYLRYRALYVNPALARLLDSDDLEDDADAVAPPPSPLPGGEGEPDDLQAQAVTDGVATSELNLKLETSSPSLPGRGLGGGADARTEKTSLHDVRLQQVAHEIYQLAPSGCLTWAVARASSCAYFCARPKSSIFWVWMYRTRR